MGKIISQPELRFPDFKGNWHFSKIGELFNVSAGGDIEKEHVSQQKNEIFQYPIYANAEKGKGLYAYSDIYKIEPNVITVAGRGVNIGIAHARNHRFYPIVRLIVLIPKHESSIFYFEYCINRMNIFVESTGVPQLTVPQISGYKVLYPTLIEQKKIASFLLSVDKRIDFLLQKKEKLEQYKKSVMQKIFNREIRFKDNNGNDFPEWEEKTLGEIGQFQTSSIDKLSRENEKQVFLVNYMNVYRHEDINNETIKRFQKVTAKDSQVLSCDLKRGDILFTPSSETPNDIGHSVVVFEDLENSAFSYHLMRFRPKIEIDILYSHYFCNTSDVLNQLSRLSTGSTRFTISVKAFSSVIIYLPVLEEQQKIASFLSTIDNKIEKVGAQIDHMKNWKKGLLQQMFV